ncbi:MAG: TRAP transporter substrate-binding protein DctP [Gammaproteobacteria bacterium]|nr:TRAP transporter substrate-binding protein DctP [Gammaproteobacteria bacterium]
MKNTLIRITILSLLLFGTTTHAAVIKIATLSPDGTAWMKKMRQAAKEITERTDKRVKIKFYPGGVMGDENSILRKMRINQLQGAAISSGALTRYYKDTALYGLPFLFDSQEEVLYVRKHMDELMVKGLEKKGMISFGLAESGFVYFLSNNPILSINDLKKEKFWVPDNTNARNTVEAFSLKPIPLPFGDVLAGLQTHLIDTIISSPIASIALQWHTQVKYLTDMPVLYSWATLVISKKAMEKLKKKDSAIVHAVMSQAFKEIDKENQADNKAALAALKSQGISFIKPTKAQFAEWKNIALKGNKELVKNGYNSQSMYNLAKKHITDYQKKIKLTKRN